MRFQIEPHTLKYGIRHPNTQNPSFWFLIITNHVDQNYCLDKDRKIDDCEILAPSYHEFKSKGVVLCDLIAAIYIGVEMLRN